MVVVIVMGVSGCGKSTVATELGRELNRPVIDADDVHTPEAKAKMHVGTPLTDADRLPWLEKLNHLLINKPNAIVACSALKRNYRNILSQNVQVWFVQLAISYDDAYARLTSRSEHFFPAQLLQDQFSILEPLTPDEPGSIISAIEPLAAVCKEIISSLPK